jgi:hypothetical protein
MSLIESATATQSLYLVQFKTTDFTLFIYFTTPWYFM